MNYDKFLSNLATLGPIGMLPAPGTMGSLVAVILGGLITINLGLGTLVIILALVTILGFPAANAHYRLTGVKDSGSVVIDEVIGQWLPLLIIPMLPSYSLKYGAALIFSFVLFRFFDILKYGLVKKAEKLPGAYGVIADDVIAGILAGLCLFIGYKIYFYSMG